MKAYGSKGLKDLSDSVGAVQSAEDSSCSLCGLADSDSPGPLRSLNTWQGEPLEKPLNGVYNDWPVGYQPGTPQR